MKSKFLIIIGFLLVLLAMLNSFFNAELFFQNQIGQLTYRFDVLIATLNPQITPIETVKGGLPANTPIVLPTIAEPNYTPSNNPEPLNPDEGFLPLQVEKKDPAPNPTQTPVVRVDPNRIVISSIDLDAPIVESLRKEIKVDGKDFVQWSAPNEFAVGWQFDSATLGVPGNTVLNGHHNLYGEVLKDLNKVVEGDKIFLYGDDGKPYVYIVTNVMIFPERDVPIEQRMANAVWILPSTDERITLITCWPHYTNTHRLIVVARPLTIDFREIQR